MALVHNISGEYHKIEYEDEFYTPLEQNMVRIEVYENEQHRIDGDSTFKKHYVKTTMFVGISIKGILCEYVNDIGKSEVDNYKTAVYNYIKVLPEYTDFIDN